MLRRRSGPAPGTDLGREAGVSLRTIYRDIATLQAMGADIKGEPGFGYILKPGFLLPPLMFTQEELQAFTLGVQWVSWQTDDGLALAAQNLIGKVGAVLPPELRLALTDDAFHLGRARPQPQSVDLKILRQAMREQFKLHIAYRDPQGTKTQRIIWPIMIGFIESRRFVAGWCELRKDFRTFRTDRIVCARLIEERYPGRRRDLAKRWRDQVDEQRKSEAGDSKKRSS